MGAPLKMKERESRTGVSREAIRFYIREGLLPEPEKPKRNVAHYSEEHVQKIRLIKQLQEEHYLPLKIVKSVMNNSGSGIQEMSRILPGLLTDIAPGNDVTVKEASETSGLSQQQIEQLAEVGAVSLDDKRISPRDLAFLTTWGEAQRQGFNEKDGFDAGFIAQFVASTKALARYEVKQFFNSFSDLDGESAADLGADGINYANRLLTLLHTRFLLEEIENQSQVPEDSNS